MNSYKIKIVEVWTVNYLLCFPDILCPVADFGLVIFFNMSTNMSNLVQNQPKSHHASRRPAHTAGGPGSNAAFHSSGIENQQDAPDSYSNAN